MGSTVIKKKYCCDNHKFENKPLETIDNKTKVNKEEKDIEIFLKEINCFYDELEKEIDNINEKIK